MVSRSPCLIGNVLDLIGDRWTLLVVRDLLFFGKHEYKEFIASPEGIATNILSDRLKKLVNAGMVNEIFHPANKSRKLYYLTPKGKALAPILLEMLLWGEIYLPELKTMKPILEKLRRNPEAFKTEIMRVLDEWEREYAGDRACLSDS
jgi:DNA-binding HxlR family transcriptional regulator